MDLDNFHYVFPNYLRTFHKFIHYRQNFKLLIDNLLTSNICNKSQNHFNKAIEKESKKLISSYGVIISNIHKTLYRYKNRVCAAMLREYGDKEWIRRYQIGEIDRHLDTKLRMKVFKLVNKPTVQRLIYRLQLFVTYHMLMKTYLKKDLSVFHEHIKMFLMFYTSAWCPKISQRRMLFNVDGLIYIDDHIKKGTIMGDYIKWRVRKALILKFQLLGPREVLLVSFPKRRVCLMHLLMKKLLYNTYFPLHIKSRYRKSLTYLLLPYFDQ